MIKRVHKFEYTCDVCTERTAIIETANKAELPPGWSSVEVVDEAVEREHIDFPQVAVVTEHWCPSCAGPRRAEIHHSERYRIKE